jgi:hypothetical protein
MAAAERRSRKRRARTPLPPMPPDATFAERAAARSEFRNEEVRSGLEPLAPGERPRSVTVAAVVALAMAALNLVVTLAGGNIIGDSGDARLVSLVTTGVLTVIGIGMLLRSYLAVLGFEIALGMQVIACALALVVTTNIWIAVVLTVVICALGTLFWKLIRAMARLQMPPARAGTDVQ